MLLSISLILIVGMSMAWLCQRLRLPGLMGMLATGMILGPYALDLLDADILGISEELRKIAHADILGISEELREIALIIILTRAGLGLDLTGLKKTGRPALLMCFDPASFEVLGVILLGTRLLGQTVLEAAVLGTVLAAVSPAVVVPRMVRLMEEGYGKREGIPQMILAGASVDDVYVTGCHRRDPSFYGLCLRRYCPYGRRACHCPYCATGGVCDGSVGSEASEQVMTVFHIRRCGSR